MSRSYCSADDVKRYLPPNLVTQGSNPVPNPRNPAPETVLTADIDSFIQDACDYIDAILGTMYDIPLQKSNQGGDRKYPPNIKRIAAIFSAHYIFCKPLQGADRQASDAHKEVYEKAMDELNSIQNGEMVLQGQRKTMSNRFIRNTLPNAPRNPAEGGRSKGK